MRLTVLLLMILLFGACAEPDEPGTRAGTYDLAFVDWERQRDGATVSLASSASEATRVVALTEGGIVGAAQIAVSPDGSALAFVSWSSPDISWHLYVLNLASGQVRDLLRLDGGAGLSGQPSWRGDGSEIAYVTFNGAPHTWDIGVVDLAGHAEVVATTVVPAADALHVVPCIRPAWSHGDGRLAFGAWQGAQLEGVVRVLDRDAGGSVTTFDPSGLGWVCRPVWAHDDSTLALTESDDGHVRWRIVQVSDDLATATPVHDLAGGGGALQVGQVQWSPDDLTLAFVDYDYGASIAALYTVRLSDSSVTQLTLLMAGVAAGHPQWSPDGGRLAFVDFDRSRQRARLRVIPAAGGDAETLVVLGAGVSAGHPVWLPARVGFAHERADLRNDP